MGWGAGKVLGVWVCDGGWVGGREVRGRKPQMGCRWAVVRWTDMVI
jgi:hypothetical protein